MKIKAVICGMEETQILRSFFVALKEERSTGNGIYLHKTK